MRPVLDMRGGKLNVPRERFRKLIPKRPYLWAGLDLFEDKAT